MPRPRKPTAADIERMEHLSGAQDAHEAAGHPSRNGPLFQAVARDELERYRKAFASGNEHALVAALDQCALHEIVMPDWLAEAWLLRSRKLRHFDAASWADVLPTVKPKGRKLAALRMEWAWTLPVVQAVHRASGPGTPVAARRAIDEQLFDELAKCEQWPFSGALAKKLYYAARRRPGAVMAHYFPKSDRPKRAAAPARSNSTIRRKS